MLSEALQQFVGLLNQLMKNLLGNDAELWGNELKKFLRKEPCWVKVEKAVASILRSISASVTISATTGTKTITSAKEVFTGYLDPDFKNWGLDVPEEAKPETPVQVYEMFQDGDFKTIFSSLGRSLDDLCLTQEQIIAFVCDHKQWLRTGGYSTFFLFKVAGEFFVAFVGLSTDGGPGVGVGRVSSAGVWRGGFRRRIVLPQLTLES